MAYNDKRLKTDLEGKPIPQAYNPDIDDYEPVHSTNNALNQVIYGPNGQPISTVGNKLAVRATELEALMQGLATEGKLEQVRQLLSGVATENKLEQARTLLEAISTKDFATSSKQDALNIAVEDLKDAISGKDFATQTTLAAVLAKLAGLESELATIKANQLSGDQKVQLSGTKVELLKEWSDTGLMSQVEWFYGNNRTDYGAGLIPVNYSAKPRKMILVRNRFDVAVACRGVYGFKDGTTQGAIAYLPFAEEVLIEANASALLTSETVPELDYNFPGIALRFMRKGTPTTGTLDIWFFGGEGGASKDFATQTTLEAALTKLVNVKSELETIKANQLSGDQKVQLSGTMVASGLLANRPPASAVPPGFAYYSWDAPEGQEMAYSDGTNWRVKS